MVSTEHITRDIPEDPQNPYRLGRNLNHDPRSADYPHARRAVPVVTRDRWPRGIPILDQGNLGSCVANTGVAACSSQSVDVLEAREAIEWAGAVSDLDQTLAVEWYRHITRADPFPGAWEPDDTGSDGTTMAEKLRQWGIVLEYRHAFGGLADVLDALMTGPVMMGSNWYSSMFSITSDGFIRITTAAWVAGGHEYLLNGRVDVENQWVELDNSWGPDWGLEGRAKMTFGTLERLLAEDGDATILKWAPTLINPPTPEPTDEQPGCNPFGRAAGKAFLRTVTERRRAVDRRLS